MLVKLSVFGKWFDLHIQFFDGNFFVFPGKSPLFAGRTSSGCHGCPVPSGQESTTSQPTRWSSRITSRRRDVTAWSCAPAIAFRQR